MPIHTRARRTELHPHPPLLTRCLSHPCHSQQPRGGAEPRSVVVLVCYFCVDGSNSMPAPLVGAIGGCRGKGFPRSIVGWRRELGKYIKKPNSCHDLFRSNVSWINITDHTYTHQPRGWWADVLSSLIPSPSVQHKPRCRTRIKSVVPLMLEPLAG